MDPWISLSTAEAAVQITRTNETWTGSVGQPATATYGFVDSGDGLKFDIDEMATTQQALDLWADLANLTFVRVGGPGNAQISFVDYRNATDAGNAAKRGTVGQSVDVGFNLANVTFDFSQGGGSRETLIHEIGHALGLKHPGDYNVGNVGDPEITYDANRGYVEDSRQYTLMSYFSEKETGADFLGAYARTPLLHDIAAIQRLYGVNMTTRTGDTVYGYNSNADRAAFHVASPDENPVFAIWDAGGIDTIDFSGSTFNQVISLWANSFSSVNGLTDNIAIAAGADIENAKGGSGIDRIYGNDLANEIWGGAGNDHLDGGLDGVKDRLLGGADNDIYYVNEAETVVENAGEGSDTVITQLANYTLPANVENLLLDPNIFAPTFTGKGNVLDNVITGGAGRDTLYGNGGNDTLRGREGADTMFGGNDDDTYIVEDRGDRVVETLGSRYDNGLAFIFTGGHDTVKTTLAERGLENYVEDLEFIGTGKFVGRGNELANVITGGDSIDTLYGFAGSDTLNGGIGADVMHGGLDDDTYIVDDEGDKTVEDVAFLDRHGNIYPTGTDTVETTLETYELQDNIENLIYKGSSRFVGTGNSSDNTIVGGKGADTLTGAGGDDTLTGRGGGRYTGDTFVFGDGWGHDTVTDFAPFRAGADRSGFDKLDMRQVTGLRSFDQLQFVAEAGGTRILFADNSILLKGVTKVTASDFLFKKIEPIVGTESADTLHGTDGDDHIDGLGGDDLLIGHKGADHLDGGLGIDTADYSASSAGVTVNLATGTGLGADAEGDILMSIEHAIGSAFDDTYQGGADRGRFLAGAGNDTMIGGSDYDWLEGGDGNDTFIGTDGSMVMFGGDGNDWMTGSLNNVNGNYFDGGTGNDMMIGGNSADYMADVIAGDDAMYGGGGNDTLVDLYGVSELYAEDGDDFVTAAGGSGLLDGGAGVDYLTVANGDYALFGGEGNDTLEGAGTGLHVFTGGAGADIFTYRVSGDQARTVSDFEDGVDRIFLWDQHYNGNVPFESLTIADSADGAVVSWNGGSHMVLTGILASQLTQVDFFY